MNPIRTETRSVTFRGHAVHCRTVGHPWAATPMLALHGDNMLGGASLEPLADAGLPVAFYDQLGGGLSDRPEDPSLATMDEFVEELAEVRRALGLGEVHLFGHSWGGKVALEYLLRRPAGVKSLTLFSSLASNRLFSVEFSRLLRELPPDAANALNRYDRDHAAYRAAWELFCRRHYCRVDPWPPCFSQRDERNRRILAATDQSWDLLERLDEIRVPTLILSGRHDVITPLQSEAMADRIPDCRWELLENSSHLALVEEPERFFSVLKQFLSDVERRAGGPQP